MKNFKKFMKRKGCQHLHFGLPKKCKNGFDHPKDAQGRQKCKCAYVCQACGITFLEYCTTGG